MDISNEIIQEANFIFIDSASLAVAISHKYGDEITPKVVLKGDGNLGQKIKESAIKYSIPLIENAMLARELYEDSTIKKEFFKTLAETLILVKAMKKSGSI